MEQRNDSNMARPRAREAGLRLGLMQPGPLNAITDVAGVLVGQVTLISGEGDLVRGQGPVRTGVTVIRPHPDNLYLQKVIAAVHTVNGYGKATGFEQVREMGTLETPIALTNTMNVGKVWDALITWSLRQGPAEEIWSVNPLVGECNDGHLNDIHGRHVQPEHVLAALDAAKSGPVQEGVVGAGTGMSCYDFKGGLGTASRRAGAYILGALVVANFGRREQLLIGGAPVGRELVNWPETGREADGSVMVVIATDAPMTARQLGRIARRAGLGLARTGSSAGNTSGDFALAFSTATRIPARPGDGLLSIPCLPEPAMNLFFQATVEAIEEAVINSMFKAETVVGHSGNISRALPIDRALEIIRKNETLFMSLTREDIR